MCWRKYGSLDYKLTISKEIPSRATITTTTFTSKVSTWIAITNRCYLLYLDKIIHFLLNFLTFMWLVQFLIATRRITKAEKIKQFNQLSDFLFCILFFFLFLFLFLLFPVLFRSVLTHSSSWMHRTSCTFLLMPVYKTGSFQSVHD